MYLLFDFSQLEHWEKVKKLIPIIGRIWFRFNAFDE